ncbi:MAG: hypothetical protein HQL52_08450 [Magnetococcales bacterium]|nr:hypothetical protein [Magnetococcales bacterium]
MTEENKVIAGLKIDFKSIEEAGPAALVEEIGEGATPVIVEPYGVNLYDRLYGEYDLQDYASSLVQREWGKRRVRLYCSSAARSGGLTVEVDDGSAKKLGTRSEKITETLIFRRARSQQLVYHYDSPSVSIIDSTDFYDNDGQKTLAPTYFSDRGEYYSAQEVTGALVVEYSPKYTLYEISYGTGEDQCSKEQWREMQFAWLTGNVNDAQIPPVTVLALTKYHAVSASLSRKFWPLSATYEITFLGGKASIGATLNDGSDTGDEESTDDQFVEQDRETIIEQIFDPGDDEIFVDVERAVAINFKDGWGQELKLRFKSDDAEAE